MLGLLILPSLQLYLMRHAQTCQLSSMGRLLAPHAETQLFKTFLDVSLATRLTIRGCRSIICAVDQDTGRPTWNVTQSLSPQCTYRCTPQASVQRRRCHPHCAHRWIHQNFKACTHAPGLCAQVELYADYDAGRLMAFLVSSQAYALEAAAELCEARGLVREQVFVLGRMGNSHQALHLIIRRLADIPQAKHPSAPYPRGLQIKFPLNQSIQVKLGSLEVPARPCL